MEWLVTQRQSKTKLHKQTLESYVGLRRAINQFNNRRFSSNKKRESARSKINERIKIFNKHKSQLDAHNEQRTNRTNQHSKGKQKHRPKQPFNRPRNTDDTDSIKTKIEPTIYQQSFVDILASAIDNLDGASTCVVDGGATKLSTPHKHHFIPGTLRPTNIMVRGMDKQLHKADAVGIAQIHFYDKEQNRIFRITTEGVLVKTAMPSSFTLISVPQLNIDGISLNQPEAGFQPSLYVGRLQDPIYNAPLSMTDNRLLYLQTLTPQEVSDYLVTGTELVDLTSKPSDVITGNLRTIEGFHQDIELNVQIIEQLNSQTTDITQERTDDNEDNDGDGEDDTSSSDPSSATFKSEDFDTRLKRCLARLESGKADHNDHRFIERYLPEKTRNVRMQHAKSGYLRPRQFEAWIRDTRGHGLKPGDSKYLPGTSHKHNAEAFHAARAGKRGDACRRGIPDPRLLYKHMESWSYDLLTYDKESYYKHYRYAMNFVELHTGYAVTYYLNKKSDAIRGLEYLRRYTRKFFQTKIKHLWSDNAKEFTSDEVDQWMAKNYINFETSSPYLHFQNGRVENFNKRVAAVTRKLLRASRQPGYAWAYAHNYAVYTLNSSGPFEKVFGRKCNSRDIIPYGTPVSVKQHNKKKKTDRRADIGIYIGPAVSTPFLNRNAPLSHVVLTRDPKDQKLGYRLQLTGDIIPHYSHDVTVSTVERIFGEHDEVSSHGGSDNDSDYEPSIFDCDEKPLEVKADESVAPTLGNRDIDGASISAPPDSSIAPPDLPEPSNVPPPTESPKAPKQSKNQPKKQPKSGRIIGPDRIPMTLIESLIRRDLAVTYLKNETKAKKSAPRWDVYKHATTTSAAIALNPGGAAQGRADLQNDLRVGLVRLDCPNAQKQVDIARGVHQVHNINYQGIIIKPLEITSSYQQDRKIAPVVCGNLVLFEDERFSVGCDIKELLETPEHLKQPMYDAIVKEITTLIEMGTFEWDNKPSGAKELPTRIVLKTKYNADGSFDKYKARLVVKGFLQRLGHDYNDTFTPTSDVGTFRTLLSLSGRFGWRVMHADIKNAFCNAKIDIDTMFVNMPHALKVTDPNPGPNRALRLKRALYGLKQAPRLFFNLIRDILVGADFEQGKGDRTLFTKRNKHGELVYVLVYVDDIIITGANQSDQDEVTKLFRSNDTQKLVVGEYAPLSSYLGINFKPIAGEHGHYADAAARITDITAQLPIKLDKMNSPVTAMSDDKLRTQMKIPLEQHSANVKYCLHNYRSIVGAINYMTCTLRYDTAVALSQLSEHLAAPRLQDALQLLHLLTYLHTTKELRLEFKPRTQQHADFPRLEIYTDSSFAEKNDPARRSRTGVVVTLDGNPIHWKTKRQSLTAISTHEAELYALFAGTREALHFRLLMKELGYSQPGATPIYVDNMSVKFTANSEYVTSAHRHIDVRYFRIRDHIAAKDVGVFWRPGQLNPADLFTKILPASVHAEHVAHLGQGRPYPATDSTRVRAGGDVGARLPKGSATPVTSRDSARAFRVAFHERPGGPPCDPERARRFAASLKDFWD